MAKGGADCRFKMINKYPVNFGKPIPKRISSNVWDE
jgi:hypothetical protein